MSRNAVAARKRKRKLDPDKDLSPGIAAGYTEGMSADDALKEHPTIIMPSGVERVSDVATPEMVPDTRITKPKFIAEDDPDTVRVIEDGRRQRDAKVIMHPETRRAIQAGHMCLRCLEPQPEAFPEVCDLCGYPMKELQVLDAAQEFEGNVHVGPSKPLSEALAEQEERMEKRRFIDKVLGGGQGKIPKAWLQDATLFPGGPPEQLA